MRAKRTIVRLVVTAAVAAVAGTVGGITLASANESSPRAAQVTGYEVVKVHDTGAQNNDVTVFCPRGKRALSGGGEISAPLTSFGRMVLSVPAQTRRSGWRTVITGSIPGGQPAAVDADFYAVCAST
jgi:hypothetical protein